MIFSARGATSLALAAAVLLAACGGGGHYADPGLHEIDGVQMTFEEPCAPEHCAEQERAAREALSLPEDTVVVRVLRASFPTDWVESTGSHVLRNRAGLFLAVVVILELGDGTRRAVSLGCGQYTGHPYDCGPQ